MSVQTNLLGANASGFDTDVTGWTPGANTTLARNTARAYAGAASMQLTATTSGSVSASLAQRVGVTPGAVLTAYSYFANIVAASGRNTTVTVSWYANVTGGSALSTVSSAAATLPTSTLWATPPPVLIATVPALAHFAQITLTVTGLTSGAQVVTDVVSLGPPFITTGSFLDYGTQGCEVDASGWSTVANASIATSAVNSYEGWRSLQITATAAGDTRIRTAADYAVTPGVEYLGYGWVVPPAAGLEFRTELWWYDGTGTFMTGTLASASSYPTSTTTWTRCTVIGTAPPGAATARLVLRPQATSAGQSWLCDQMFLRDAPILPGTMLGYNAQSMEVDVSGWTITQGGTIAQSGTRAWDGVASMAITADGTADPVVNLNGHWPVEARQAYQIVPHVYMPASGTVDLLFTWYDDADAVIRSTFYRWNLTSGAGWYAPTGSFVPPEGAVTASAGLQIHGATAGTVYYVDGVLLGPGGLGVIADPITDAYGVRVSLQGLTTGGHTYWGLWRMLLSDGSQTPVRGADGDLTQQAITGDVGIQEDYEAPLGQPVVYQARLWTTPTAMESSTSEPITIASPGDSHLVIKDPALPVRSNSDGVVTTAPDWQRQARQGVYQVRGRVRPIVITDVRSSRTGSMVLTTETQDERDAIWFAVETGNTLLLQWPDGWGLGDMYVQIGDVTEARLSTYAAHADREWTFTLTEVDRPIGGLVGSATRVWQNVLDDNTSWQAVYESASSWLDVLTGVRGS